MTKKKKNIRKPMKPTKRKVLKKKPSIDPISLEDLARECQGLSMRVKMKVQELEKDINGFNKEKRTAAIRFGFRTGSGFPQRGRASYLEEEQYNLVKMDAMLQVMVCFIKMSEEGECED